MSDQPRRSFPHQWARTQRFTLGLPRSFTVSPDGKRVAFLRSAAGDDPVTALWVFDLEEKRERLVFDPHSETVDAADLPPEERARRERARERAEGVVAYSTNRDVTTAAFSLDGRLFVADLISGDARRLPAVEPVYDPRLDPSGTRIAYVSGRSLRVIEADGGDDRLVVGEDDPNVSWGVAEFVAAEEMDRKEGFWWSPDGTRLAVARVDETRVTTWYIPNPVDPDAEPQAMRYPQTGTDNADVSLHVFGADGKPTEVRWDREGFEYLARVVWNEGRPLTLLAQSRDQTVTQVLTVDDEGSPTLLREDTDPRWVELVAGSPAWLDDGRLVSTIDADDTRRLAIDGEPVTPPGLQVRRIAHVYASVLFVGSEDPLDEHVYRWSDGSLERLTDEPGVHAVEAEGDVAVITSATLDREPTTTIRKGGEVVATLASNAEQPVVDAKPTFYVGGERKLNMALLTPGGAEPDGPLPVLLDPYGGPLYQRVTHDRWQYLESQWFADQGFAVLVADGRGTPGRGTAWEKEVYLDLFGPPLEDQVDALHAAAEKFPFLDLTRVAIRGWSFGGCLAALAVLRRSDVFRAAVAGAPVTDETLYDTHYNERYLRRPQDHPEVYRRNTLVDDAPNLGGELLLIHGLSDDNVFVGNSLRLSRALLEAGKAHTFLPLSGSTHMPKGVDAFANLLMFQVRFLREALGREPSP